MQQNSSTISNDGQTIYFFNGSNIPNCISSNSGMTWSGKPTIINSNSFAHYAICDSSGTKLAVINLNGFTSYINPAFSSGVVMEHNIYNSTDSGSSWIENSIPVPVVEAWVNNLFTSIASDTTGQYLVIVSSYGSIYTSIDGGTNWNSMTIVSHPWISVASSSDGQKLVVVSNDGSIYNSIDGGTNWNSMTIVSHPWISVASSSDGQKLVVVSSNGFIYTSINGGVNWSSSVNGISGTNSWNIVSSSSDGTTLVVTASNLMYRSTNSGLLWNLFNANPIDFDMVKSNGDGNIIVGYSKLNNNISVTTTNVFIYNFTTRVFYILNPNDNSVTTINPANICFPKGTPILTDQGIITIDEIDIDVNTINQKKIVDITKTVSKETFLVCFDKDALGFNMPNQETIISPGHKVTYEGDMHQAKWFLEKFPKVKSIPYTGKTLYNVLLEKHDVMNVNNLICETLLPENPIAKFYTKQCKLSAQDRDIMIKVLQGCLDRNDFTTYSQIMQCC